MLMSTLKDLESRNPCRITWESLLKSKPGIDPDTPFPISDCLPHITLREMLGLLDQIDDAAARRVKITFVCDCAERVLKFFEAIYPGDMRPRHAIDAARLFRDSTDVVHDAADAAYVDVVHAASVAAAYAPAASASFDAAYAAAASASAATSAVATCNNYYIANAVFYAASAVFYGTDAANAAADAALSAVAANATVAADAARAERAWQIAHLKSLLDGSVSC